MRKFLAISSAIGRLKAARPEQWFLVGFVILFLAFAVVLVVQPSAVGRGGR